MYVRFCCLALIVVVVCCWRDEPGARPRVLQLAAELQDMLQVRCLMMLCLCYSLSYFYCSLLAGGARGTAESCPAGGRGAGHDAGAIMLLLLCCPVVIFVAVCCWREEPGVQLQLVAELQVRMQVRCIDGLFGVCFLVVLPW